MSTIESFIERLNDKPLASSIVALLEAKKTIKLLDDSKTTTTETIQEAITQISPNLYAFLFKQAGLSNTTDSIRESLKQVIAKLGFERIKRLIFFYLAYTSDADQSATKEDKEFSTQLWSLNYAVASQSEFFGSLISKEFGEESFYLGMFQNIGISAFAQLEPVHYRDLRQSKYKTPLATKETDWFGFNHYDLGCAIVNEWKLPSIHIAALKYEESHGQSIPEMNDKKIQDLLLFLYFSKYRYERSNYRKNQGRVNELLDAYFKYDQTLLQNAVDRIEDYKTGNINKPANKQDTA